ncbi:MAG TPA: hypothetical protein VNI01_07480, partial [Elusimicrobiota bacterium]|nr:hypothetical protein [Elusimicrobiota bacterium]
MNAGALLSLCLAVSGRAAQVSGRAASPVGAPTAAVPPLSAALSAPTGALSADFQPGLLPSALGVAAAPDLPSAALSAPSPRAEAVPAADEPSAGAFSAAPLEISAPGPAAAAAVRRASRSEAAQESRDESSSRAQPARSSLAAAARGGALAVGELFDGQRPEPGAAREAAPDFPLTGASGEEVLSALRARADAALIEKDVREGKPTPAPGSTGRPEGWALRVDNWILGQQALVREPLTRWMAERSFVSRALGGTPLDVETFLVALAKVNAALDGLAPPIQAADLFVLGEAGLDEPRPDGPDLRAVGALHPGGRVHVLASFAQTLTPEELAAAVLREH